MQTYIITNSILILIILSFVLYIFYTLKKSHIIPDDSINEKHSELKSITDMDWKVKGLLIVSVSLILFSFLSPFLFTRNAPSQDFNFSQYGQIGDTIGGLMNPFITLSGVFVTGLAFYIQYKANLLQRKLFIQEQAENKLQLQEQIDNQNHQIKIQKFESRFYEMLKLHRENVNEMSIAGYDFDESNNFKKIFKSTEGRKVFVTMKTELESIIAIMTENRSLNQELFIKCYKLFFSGLDEFEKTYEDETEVVIRIRQIRETHEFPDRHLINTNAERKKNINNYNLNFNYKPFSGHASRLGHYFRHLYLIVKSVANSEIITDYTERMHYLRVLRAQLSNHEQILLFYNWLSGYGADWENNKHSFFTEYSMIHNLWYDNLYSDKFIEDKVNFLRTKKVNFRNGNMFEID